MDLNLWLKSRARSFFRVSAVLTLFFLLAQYGGAMATGRSAEAAARPVSEIALSNSAPETLPATDTMPPTAPQLSGISSPVENPLSSGGASIAVNTPFVQLTSSPDVDEIPGITRTADGRLWMVWDAWRSSNYDIYLKTSTDDGLTWSGDVRLTTDSSTDAGPDIAQTADGRVWVVWHSYRSGSWDVWYKSTGDGGATWSPDTRLTTSPDTDSYPAITQTNDGRLWVVWHSLRAGNWDIYYKTSSDNGATWSPEVRLTSDAQYDAWSSVTQTADGKMWVTWAAYRGNNYDIVCRTSTDGGSTWSAETRLTTDPGSDYAPSMVQTGDGKVWLAWYSYRSGNSDIWYKTSTDGGATWSADTQYTGFTGYDTYPDICPLANSTVAFVWQSDRAANYDIWFGILGTHGDSNPPPHLDSIWQTPAPNPESDEAVTIAARLSDETGVNGGVLVWTINDVQQAELTLYDTGTHGDAQSGDRFWTTRIGPFPVDNTVKYQFRFSDTDGNIVTAPSSPVSFKPVQPWAASTNILLVADSVSTWEVQNNSTPYKSALEAMGLPYDFWDVSLRGTPDQSELAAYRNGAVIWMSLSSTCFNYGWQMYYARTDAITALQSYLNGGGKLFMAGNSLSQYLSGDSFFTNYLHAAYAGSPGLYRVLGANGDPIGGGLSLALTSSGMEIDPLSPAVPIFSYDPTATLPFSRSRNGSDQAVSANSGDAVPDWTEWPQGNLPTLSLDTPVTRSPDSRAILSSGGAGVRVETAAYKLVYLSFGFENLVSTADQNLLMSRVMSWLAQGVIPTERPDLIVDSKSEHWLAGKEGQQYTVDIIVKNTGTAVAPAGAICDLYVDGNLKSTDVQELTVNLVSEPATIDPNRASWTNDLSVIRQCFEGLLGFNQDLTLKPVVATEVPTTANSGISQDGKTYTFHLKADATWSDGQPVTAADFEYSIKRLLSPDMANEYASFYFGIVGAEAYYNSAALSDAQKTALRNAVGVNALDDHTLEITLYSASPTFLQLMAMWPVYPLREDIISQFGDGWTTPPNYVGNGPFKLVEWVHSDHMTFVRNPHYSGTKPALTKITYKMISDANAALTAYQNNLLDQVIVPSGTERTTEADPVLGPQVVRYNELVTYACLFNVTKPPFNNEKLRQAIACAIDRQAYVDTVRGGLGEPALSWIPPGMPGHDPELGGQWAFNSLKARQLLAEAGYPDGAGLPELKFQYSNTASNTLMAQFLQAQLRDNLGINLTLEPMSAPAFSTAFNTMQYTMAWFGWGADYPDPDNWLPQIFGTGGGINRSGYSNPAFDALAAQALSEFDNTLRLQLWAEAQQIVIDDCPIIPIFYRERMTLKKPWVAGQQITSLDGQIAGDILLSSIFIDKGGLPQLVIDRDLAPGETWSGTFSSAITFTAPNDEVRVVVDASNVIHESDETNNSLSNILVSPKPDLIISAKSEPWVQGQAGIKYTVNFTVKNTGEVTAPAGTEVGLTVDGTPVQEFITVPVDLAPQGTWSGSFTTQIVLSDGSDEVQVCADAGESLSEASETNNCLTNVKAISADIRIVPSTQTVGINQVFSVQIWVDASLRDIDTIQTYLDFDTSVLQVVDAAGNVLDGRDEDAITSGVIVLGETADFGFPDRNKKIVDNSGAVGRIDLALGVGTGGFPIQENFMLATIRFKALQVTDPDVTHLLFQTTDELRTTRAIRDGADVTGTVSDGEINVIQGVQVVLGTTLQRTASPPSSQWVTPMRVWIHQAGAAWDAGAVNYGAALYVETTTNSQGKITVVIPPGIWDIRVKGKTSLKVLKRNVSVAIGMGEVNMGILYEGDTNDDNVIDGVDYSTVVMCYGTSTNPANATYLPQSPWADFNNDGVVEGLDYSRLLGNFLKKGADIP